MLKKKNTFSREIFETDNYSPIPVETEEEYKVVVSRFPFHDAEIEKVPVPAPTSMLPCANMTLSAAELMRFDVFVCLCV